MTDFEANSDLRESLLQTSFRITQRNGGGRNEEGGIQSTQFLEENEEYFEEEAEESLPLQNVVCSKHFLFAYLMCFIQSFFSIFILSQYKFISINFVYNENLLLDAVIFSFITNAILRFLCPWSLDRFL